MLSLKYRYEQIRTIEFSQKVDILVLLNDINVQVLLLHEEMKVGIPAAVSQIHLE